MEKEISKTIKLGINKSIDNYLVFLQTCDWTNKEIYKFEFANWINSKISLTKSSDRKILKECLKSQNLLYTNGVEKGIQFIKTAGREKRTEFFSMEDVKILKDADLRGLIDKEKCKNRTISFTGLSSWLGTLSPLRFIPAPVIDFYKVFQHLFNDLNVPRRGFRAFSKFQNYCQIIREEFHDRVELEWMYLNQINTFRTSIQLPSKEKYDAYDINWIIEDFILYVHRIELELYDTSYLTQKFLSPIEESRLNSRSLIAINRIHRDNSIVRKLKSIYDNSCQICGLRSNKSQITFVEGAHIKPLGGIHNGRDTLTNLLCLCPNHHKLFDLGEFWINENLEIKGLEGFEHLNLKHKINLGNLYYHKTEIYDSAQHSGERTYDR